MNTRRILPLLDIDRPVVERYLFNLAEFFAAGLAQVLAAPQVGFLHLEAVAMDRGFRRAASAGKQGQARAPGPRPQQTFTRWRRQGKVPPPSCFGLPPVPVEDVGKHPARMLPGSALGRVDRDVMGQPVYKSLNLL